MKAQNWLPEVTLMSDVQVQSIPLTENGEDLVDIRSLTDERLVADERLAEAGPQRFMLRLSVVRRLLSAAAALPSGMMLGVVEGYRSATYQTQVYNEYLDTLQADNPDWSDPHARLMATRYASAPSGVSPHSTGGAVDVVLLYHDGSQVDVGADINETPEDSEGRCYTHALLSEEARRNRDILTSALTEQGLVNYPTEWWHWSFGEQYWAYVSGASATIYSPVEISAVGSVVK